jgi:tetratricopeptide (TPR) repeat protein
MTRFAPLLCASVLLATTAAWTGPAGAQQRARPDQAAHTQLMSELARLRQATGLEQTGDIAGAEKLVRDILQANPTSLSALLTLERLLDVQGRTKEIIAPIDRLLELDPKSVVGHQTRIRVLGQQENSQPLEAAASTWIRAMPNVETPYREIALVWRQRADYDRAIGVLEQGRKRVDRSDALALELGDAHLAAGNDAAVAQEWARAVGREGRGHMLIQRRLQELPDGGASIIPQLVEQLAATPRTSGRLRAAALLAIDAGLESRAQRYVTDLLAMAAPTERDPALIELARRADGAGLYRIASWAYGEMLRDGREPGSTLAIRSRLAELALLTGDTATAAVVYRELEQAAAAGSPQRRQALALRIQLTARDGELERAADDVERLRTEYPQAPELDQTAAEVAELFLAHGDVAGAARVMDGVTGKHVAQLRGRMALIAGDLALAREELLAAAPRLRGAEATETIALAALIMRLSSRSGELLARVVGAAEPDRERAIADAMVKAEKLPGRERAAIYDFLASLADSAKLPELAEDLRRRIIADHPSSHEAPAALLTLARHALKQPEMQDEARVLLEKVILEYPRSTVVPQARRELERLRGRT